MTAAALEPLLLSERAAAALLARSVSWIRAARQKDHEALARGGATEGPTWVTVGRSIFYRPEDLRRWVEEKAEPYGKITFEHRGRA